MVQHWDILRALTEPLQHQNYKATTRQERDEIRTRFAQGDIRKCALAREYGISPCSVGDIIAMKRRKNL
jgi:hypothetical protein